MAKRKTKSNARKWKADGGFKICREPLVDPGAHAFAPDAAGTAGLPHVHWRPMLFAVARDPHTIFASWNIDWRSVFQKAIPADRLVHLRLISERGVEKRVAIEPMTSTHYLTTPGSDDSYRVEIGYFQPGDTWNSMAISERIAMPPSGFAAISDIDLATIPFHVGFQQLLDLFKPTSEVPLAVAISRFEQRVLSNRHQGRQLNLKDKKILQRLGVSRLEIAAQRRRVDQTQGDKLSRRASALFAVSSSSPASGFQAGRTSARC